MITIRLMGGLGNQMFQYAALRSYMLDWNEEGTISLKGITNKNHNVYSLNHFNLNNNIRIKKSQTVKVFFAYIFYGFFYLFYSNKKNGLTKFSKIQNKLNFFGIYCVPDGYINTFFSKSKSKELVGYFQSPKYFEKHKDVIIKELTVRSPLKKANIELSNNISKCNSVCLHIRRGDYIGSIHQICDNDYYYSAMKKINSMVSNAIFYVFSDDIRWVKENMNFVGYSVIFMDKNNSNYEELKLMYMCNHFIISNSSFSWWAQYLSENKNKIVIAPDRWFNDKNKKTDLYQKNWILIGKKSEDMQ